MNCESNRLETIFAAALEREGDERRQFVAQACGGDAAMREEVERLLRNLGRAGGFLTADAGGESAGSVESFHGSQPGDTIGRYKLLEKIGEGGCGVVYMAGQEEPVRRKVALKVIKPGMDSKSVIARFEAERQALAMMDHPNIAKVHDGGMTENGRPFFVMELVRGVRITEYCQEQKLGTRERLDLFIAVCSAVQHAHQKGIIHRDLKPSNILITEIDGKPVPKVIDFGIAKATEQKLTDKTLFTQFAQFIGTPAYMSPEQAALTSVDIDTRSDIYSLGVLLYELLTGTTPFDAQDLLKAGFDEMRRIIRETEPPKPSTRLTQSRSRSHSTVPLHSALPTPHSALSSDLDWIVMKCLEKDRARRYETASGLAADIERHLSSEPVTARPPSVAYRFRKMVGRNKVAFAAASAVGTALMIGLSLSTWLFIKEREVRRRAVDAEQQQNRLRQQAENALTKAEAAEKKAAEEAAMAEAVSDFLRVDLLQTAGSGHQREYLRTPPNPNLTVMEALDRAAEGIRPRFHDRPLVEAAIRYTVGKTYSDLGDYWAAVTHLERALELRRTGLGAGHEYTRWTMGELAGAYIGVGRPESALPLYEECLRLAREQFAPGDPDITTALCDLGHCYNHLHRPAEAIRLLEEVLKADEAFYGQDSKETAGTLSVLAVSYGQAHQWEKAIECGERALKIQEIAVGPDHPATITTKSILADNYLHAGRTNDGLPLLEESLRLSRTFLGFGHPWLVDRINAVAKQYQKLGRDDEAEALIHESAEMAQKLQKKAPDLLIRSLRLQADYLNSKGRPDEAEPLYREAAQAGRTSDDPKLMETAVEIFADFLTGRSRFADAEGLYREMLASARTRCASGSSELEHPIYNVAEVLFRQGKFAEAEPLYREHLQSQVKRLPATDDDLVGTAASLARLLADWAWADCPDNSGTQNSKPETVERAREAERLLREGLAARMSNSGVSRGRLGDTKSRLGSALLSVAVTDPALQPEDRIAKLGEAEGLLLGGHELLEQSKSVERKYRRDARERLVRFYTAVAKPDKAAEWQRNLEEFDRREPEKQSPPVEGAATMNR